MVVVPILVTLVGMVTDVSFVHEMNKLYASRVMMIIIIIVIIIIVMVIVISRILSR